MTDALHRTSQAQGQPETEASTAHGDAADRILTGKANRGERLDLASEFLNVSISVYATAKLAGIAATLYQELLRQKSPDFNNPQYVSLLLTTELSDEFQFLVEHIAEKAREANERTVALEEFLAEWRAFPDRAAKP